MFGVEFYLKLYMLATQVMFVLMGFFSYTDMVIRIQNIESGQGKLMVAVYDRRDGYMNLSKAIFLKAVPRPNPGTVEVVIPGLTDRRYYAITCYHDKNGNGRLDRNFFGVPTEPYGFSRDSRPKFRAPEWDEVCILWRDSRPVVEIRLDTW